MAISQQEAASSRATRDGDDSVGFVAGVFELAPAGVQAALRAPGDVDDLGCVSALAALERFPDHGTAAGEIGMLARCPGVLLRVSVLPCKLTVSV